MCYVRDNIAKIQPNLLRFAQSLCKNPTTAEDLVSETTIKALTNAHLFRDQSIGKLRAWTFVILRNCHYANNRRGMSREIACMEIDPVIPVEPAQNHHMDLLDAKAAILTLPTIHQEILLQAESALTYKDMSAISTLEIGTAKSRLSRARKNLKKVLNADV